MTAKALQFLSVTMVTAVANCSLVRYPSSQRTKRAVSLVEPDVVFFGEAEVGQRGGTGGQPLYLLPRTPPLA